MPKEITIKLSEETIEAVEIMWETLSQEHKSNPDDDTINAAFEVFGTRDGVYEFLIIMGMKYQMERLESHEEFVTNMMNESRMVMN